jgi:hypothetical protein
MIEDVLRTIHSGRYLVMDALNSVADALNLVTDTLNLVTDNLNLVTDNLNLVTDTGDSIVDPKRDIRNPPHSASVIDSMRGLYDLRSSHLNLLLCQTV